MFFLPAIYSVALGADLKEANCDELTGMRVLCILWMQDIHFNALRCKPEKHADKGHTGLDI